MATLKEVADRHPLVKKILADITIGHTDAAAQINFHFKNNYQSRVSPDWDFTTTEASVRRWRGATMDALDSAESHAEPLTDSPGSSGEGIAPQPRRGAYTAARYEDIVSGY